MNARVPAMSCFKFQQLLRGKSHSSKAVQTNGITKELNTQEISYIFSQFTVCSATMLQIKDNYLHEYRFNSTHFVAMHVVMKLINTDIVNPVCGPC